MDEYNVKNIIFSSSATVYKPDEKSPFSEETPT
jgi:UDP-glucose 4-epimerase